MKVFIKKPVHTRVAMSHFSALRIYIHMLTTKSEEGVAVVGDVGRILKAPVRRYRRELRTS